MTPSHRLLVRLPLTFLVLVALAAPPPAASEASPQPPVPVEAWGREERTLDLRHDAAGFRFESRRDSDLGSDELRGAFDLGAAAYDVVFVSTEPGDEAVLRLRTSAVSLLEFRDADGDARLGPGDTTVQRVRVDTLGNASLAVEPRVDGSFVAVASYPFPGAAEPSLLPVGAGSALPPGRLELRFVATPRLLPEAGRILLPTETDLRATVTGFPFAANDTRLALELAITSNAPLEGGNDRLFARLDPFESALRWQLPGDAQSRVLPDAVTVLRRPPAPGGADEPVTLLVAKERADYLRLGLGTGVVRYEAAGGFPPAVAPAASAGDVAVYATGVLLSGLAVGGTAWARLRRGA